MKSETFCVLPWLHRFTNIGGEVQVCCSSEEFDNSILSDSGEKISIHNHSQQECQEFSDEKIMNTSYMKNLRQQMLQGQWPKVCERCKVTEKAGGVSRRQSENLTFEEKIPNLISSTRADGLIPVKILSKDFRLGNLCNLACRMCGPRSSTRWVQDLKKLSFDLTSLNLSFENYQWYHSKDVLSEFSKTTRFLEHLHFAGGEPLIIPEMLDFLRVCIENGDAEHITLTYNTNLTKLSPALKDLWTKFKEVRLWVSVDGYGKTNEYIRSGSKWDSIDRNLRELEKSHKDYGVTVVEVMCTLQIYNVFSVGELFDYLIENYSFVCPYPKLISLFFPKYLRTQILPPDLKAKAIKYLKGVLAQNEKRALKAKKLHLAQGSLENLKSGIHYLSLEDQSRLIPVFAQFTQKLDRYRKQELAQVAPDLKPLLHPFFSKINGETLGMDHGLTESIELSSP